MAPKPEIRGSDRWRVRRMEQIAEVHHVTAKPKDLPSFSDDQLEGQMIATMQYFSLTMKFGGDGRINLAGPYDDRVWTNEENGYYLRSVPLHAFALVVRKNGSWKGGYTVKFFDPNYGESKFRDLETFKLFLNRIANVFNVQYHQKHMKYHLFE